MESNADRKPRKTQTVCGNEVVVETRFLTPESARTKAPKCYLEFCKVGTPERPRGVGVQWKGRGRGAELGGTQARRCEALTSLLDEMINHVSIGQGNDTYYLTHCEESVSHIKNLVTLCNTG